MTHPLYLIAAVDKNHGIGKNGTMPWHLKKELAYFQETTLKAEDAGKQNMVIMGRKTWESLPKSSRPLKGRRNIVITRQKDYQAEGAEIVHSLDEAISAADEGTDKIFVMGGGSIYEQAINHETTTGVYLTRLNAEFDCDTFFPEIPDRFKHEEYIKKDKDKNIEFECILIN